MPENLGFTTLSLDGSTLSSVDMIQFELIDVLLLPDSTNVLAIVENKGYEITATETYLVEIDTISGMSIWQSAAIAGGASKNALKWGKIDAESHSLLISTDAGMMITH